MRPLSLAEKYSTFARKDTLIGLDHWTILHATSLLVHVPKIVSSVDLSAARAWIHVAEDFQHPMVLLAYETSLRLRLIRHLAHCFNILSFSKTSRRRPQ